MSLLSKLHAVGRSKKRAAASGSSVKKTAEKPVVKSEAKIAAAHVGHPKANVVLSLLDTSGVSPKKALKIIS
ncbi:MAG: hypothetical protein MSA55_04145, partial [Coriobacteriaceae bacterium]|nr:hypothetical protein [Coriobacteriaceae bacterium]